jgi:hypothetical protein
MDSQDSRIRQRQPNTRIRSRPMYRLREPRNAAFVGLLIAGAVVILFLLLKNDDNGSSNEPAATGGAEGISVQGLNDLAASVDHPVYWAGPRADSKYELTISDQGNIFVRYLDPNTPVGSRQVASLTVGTYPVTNAYAALQKVAKQPGAKTDSTPDGAFVVTNSNNPQSVYIAYPDSDHQIEVYDPDPKEALSLATSGAIVPIS